MLPLLALCFYYLCGHGLADYALQSNDMAKGKSPNQPDGAKPVVSWWYWLGAHAAIHGLTAALVTAGFLHAHGARDPWLLATGVGMFETLVHFQIDLAKCLGLTTMNQDQAMHALCKAGYAVFLVLSVA